MNMHAAPWWILAPVVILTSCWWDSGNHPVDAITDSSDAYDWYEDWGEPEIPYNLVWVSIPAGTFEMGCVPEDLDCQGYEKPRHTVRVDAFQMTETEITQFQYATVTGSPLSGGCADCFEPRNWDQAKAFCEAIGGRLPSEAEWEYAGRGGTETIYACGNDPSCLDSIARYDNGSGVSMGDVAQKNPNAFGLYDMFGNAWEWVEDCLHFDYDGAPSTGEVWNGGDCYYRMLRGGSGSDGAWSMRASHRYWIQPSYGLGSHGFRCAK